MLVYKKILRMKLKLVYLKTGAFKTYSNVPKTFLNFSLQLHGGKFKKKVQTKYLNKSLKMGISIFNRKPFYYPSKKLMKKLK